MTGRSDHLSEIAAAREHAVAAARIQELEAKLAQSNEERDALRATLTRVEDSVIWQTVGAIRRRIYGRIGEDSRGARALRAALRRVAGLKATRRVAVLSTAPPAPIARVPEFAEPVVSLILPVHSQPELTTACVRALVATT